MQNNDEVSPLFGPCKICTRNRQRRQNFHFHENAMTAVMIMGNPSKQADIKSKPS